MEDEKIPYDWGKWVRVDENLDLTQHHLFWVVLGIGFALALTACITATLNTSWTSCWRSDCFITAVRFNTVPLGILASLIPLVGLIAAIHRSKVSARQIHQANKQIGLTSHQNNFKNHIDHKLGFFQYLDEILNEDEFLAKRELLYKFMFSNAPAGDLTVPVESALMHIKNLRTILGTMKTLGDRSDNKSQWLAKILIDIEHVNSHMTGLACKDFNKRVLPQVRDSGNWYLACCYVIKTYDVVFMAFSYDSTTSHNTSYKDYLFNQLATKEYLKSATQYQSNETEKRKLEEMADWAQKCEASLESWFTISKPGAGSDDVKQT